MKNFLLTSILALSSLVCQALNTFVTSDGCISYNATTHRLTLRVDYSASTNWGYVDGEDSWIYVRLSPSAPNYIGPFAATSCDPLTKTCEYDISSLIGSIAVPGCYEFFSVTSWHPFNIPLPVPPANPGITDMLPTPGPIWCNPDGTLKWSLALDQNGTDDLYGKLACTCQENTDSLIVAQCNSNFLIRIEHYFSPLPSNPQTTVTTELEEFHPSSTYQFDWGDGTITSLPQSHIYTPGPFSSGCYTICVTETTATGCVCRSCIQFCLPVPDLANSYPCDSVTPSLIQRSAKETITDLISKVVGIQPNPARDVVEIEFLTTGKEPVSIKVTDAAGKLVHASKEQVYDAGNQKIILNTSNFIAGLYMVQIKIGNDSTTEKLIIAR